MRSELAVPAKPDRALHVPLHREINPIIGNAGHVERRRGEAHHHFRTADEGDRFGRIKLHVADQLRDDPDMAVPALVGVIDRHLDLDVEARAPGFEFASEQHVRRIARAEQNRHPAISRPVFEHFEDGRTERGEAEPTGNEQYVGPHRDADRPAGAERAAHAEDIARLAGRNGPADGPDIAYGVDEAVARVVVAADADRDFADAKGIDHVELTRPVVGPVARNRGQFERDGVGQFATDRLHPVEFGHQRIGRGQGEAVRMGRHAQRLP